MLRNHHNFIPRLLAPWTVWALLLGGNFSASGAEMDVHQVKARYIYNFVKYITWPPTATQVQSFKILIVDALPLKSALDEVLATKDWQGKPFEAVAATSLGKESPQIVYFRETNRDRIVEALQALPKNVMTVGEGPSFLAKGGMVEFNHSEGKVRFSINLKALREAGFKVESRLLTAAQEVRK